MIIDPSILIEWATYQQANRKARHDYLLRTGQLKTIRVRDQRGRKRASHKQA